MIYNLGMEVGQTEYQPPKEAPFKYFGRSIASIAHPERNEDAIARSDEGDFALVCDGMGGMSSGEVASKAARSFIAEQLRSFASQEPETVKVKIEQTLVAASKMVEQTAPYGGTTAVVAKFFEDRQRVKRCNFSFKNPLTQYFSTTIINLGSAL